jgi:serine/threonine protein kinase
VPDPPPPQSSVPETWDWADRVATEFEDALNRSERPSIRGELERISPEGRGRLLTELIGLEIVHRRRAGEAVGPADYEPDFPELRSLAPEARSELLDWIERSVQSDTTPPPARIGRYPILARLEGGGQAQTFRALHPGLQMTVVVKWARHRAAPGMLDRIGNEGRLLVSLPPHKNLVKVYDVDFHDGRVFLVLEDVPGPTLEQYARGRPFDARWAARTVAAIAGALHEVHELGITHQDLNPRNVLIDREGQPRVIDCGVAWHRPWWVEPSDSPPIGGTPHYLAPEQAAGQSDRIGRATDVFGLGGILFFLLTSSALYSGDCLSDFLPRAREAAFDRGLLNRAGIPPRLRAICLKALAREPADRFATAAQLAQALGRFLAPRRLGYPALLAAVFLLSFGLAWSIQPRRLDEPAPPAGIDPPALQVRIWRPESEFQPLSQALPIRPSDEVQIRCRVPKGQRVAIYLVNALGKLQFVEQYPVTNTDREVIHPAEGQTRVLRGQPGTEMILALGGSGGITPEELHRLWASEPGEGAWPALPRNTVVHLQADRVLIEGERTRDLGEIRDRADPQERIRRRLDRLRERLQPRCSLLEGWAFAHK